MMNEAALKVLLVEDNGADARYIQKALESSKQATFSIQHVTHLEKASASANANSFDIVILDLFLPDSDGLQTLKDFRAKVKSVPIIVLTGNETEGAGVEAVRGGAEEYLLKNEIPYDSLGRFIAMVIERRKFQKDQSGDSIAGPITVGNLKIDLIRQSITLNKDSKETPIALTPIEFKILALLARRRGEVLARSQIVSEIWGMDQQLSVRTVDKHMSSLRRKCFPELECIENVYGVGYCLSSA